MSLASKIAVLLAALAAAPAAAHETGDRTMGVVMDVAPDRIVIRAADGHAVSYAVTPDTLVVRGDKPARLEDVRVGERAVVHGKRVGGTLRAIRLRLGPAPAAR